MKTLKFNFSHPFKGHAIIKMLGAASVLCKNILLNSKQSDLIEIPLKGFLSGKYEVLLDWEVDNRFFTYHEEFEINDKPDFIPAAS